MLSMAFIINLISVNMLALGLHAFMPCLHAYISIWLKALLYVNS